MIINNKLYDILSYCGKIVLPALSVFYATLGKTWGLPYTTEIPASIMALDTFLNALLQVSKANYYKNQAESTIADNQEYLG